MPSLDDLVDVVRGPVRPTPLVAIWALPPTTAGVVGGIPDMIRYYFDVEERLRLDGKLRALLPEALILPGYWPSLGVVVEASAFGGQIIWSRTSSPHIYPCLRIEDVDSLRLPTPGEAGLTPLLLAQMREIRRHLQPQGADLDRIVKSMGPAEICGLLLGYESYFFGLHDDPARIKALMEMVTAFIIRWLRMQAEVVGEPQVLQIADHVPCQIRVEPFRELILPYLCAIYAEFPGPVKIYHNEGWHSDAHIGLLPEMGADVWHFGSDVHSLKEYFDKVGDALVPFGGINPHGPMRHGTPEAVRSETRAAVTAARGKRILLSTGTGTTPETTLENVRAMIEAALE